MSKLLVLICALALPLLGLAQDVELERNVIYLKNAEASGLAETLNEMSVVDRRFRITVDARTNSLAIESAPQDFAAIRDIVAQLDARRPQVLIESVLVELRSDAARTLESEPLIEAMREAAPLTGAILGRSVEVRSEQPGGSAPRPPLEAALLLGTTNRGLRIVYASSILTADSEDAQLLVDANVERLYGVSRDPLVTITAGRDPVSTLRITPQIRDADAGELVLAVDADEEPFRNGPWVFKEGEALLLGGPIRTLGTWRTLGVPVLGALPVVGRFLRLPVGGFEEAQLLVVLTARIVRDPGELQSPSIDPVVREKVREQLRLRMLSDSWRDLAQGLR